MPDLNPNQFGSDARRTPEHVACPVCKAPFWNEAARDKHYEDWEAPVYAGLGGTRPERRI